jgi:hypothetical protein
MLSTVKYGNFVAPWYKELSKLPANNQLGFSKSVYKIFAKVCEHYKF